MNSKNNNLDNKKIIAIVISIIVSIIIFIFLMIRFKKKDSEIKYGYQYFPKDITTINQEKKVYESVEDCIEDCKEDGYCGGLTFDTTSNICYKFNKGEIVPGEKKHIAWEKEKQNKDIYDKTLLTGKVDNETIITKDRLFVKANENKYAFSFWLNIKDFYGDESNHKYWKHILNKGNVPDLNKKTDNWKDIENVVKNQSPGVWLAPYSNNIRVCFTVNINNLPTNILHPNQEKYYPNEKIDEEYYLKETFKYKTIKEDLTLGDYIQYIDIPNIPINKLFLISINIIQNVIEIYINDKLHKSMILYGKIISENNNIYIKSKPSFNGSLYNLNYFPYTLKYKDIKNLYKKKPL